MQEPLCLLADSACVVVGPAGSMLGGQDRNFPFCSFTAPAVTYVLVDIPHLEYSALTAHLDCTAETPQ